MNHVARQQEFLARLWELQGAARMSDAELARRIGVHQAAISRRRNGGARTLSTKFILGAVDTFPELGCILHPDLQIITSDLKIGQSANSTA